MISEAAHWDRPLHFRPLFISIVCESARKRKTSGREKQFREERQRGGFISLSKVGEMRLG